jgi:hypothetical protein
LQAKTHYLLDGNDPAPGIKLMQMGVRHAAQYLPSRLSITTADQGLVGNYAPLLHIDDGLERVGNAEFAWVGGESVAGAAMSVRRRHKTS